MVFQISCIFLSYCLFSSFVIECSNSSTLCSGPDILYSTQSNLLVRLSTVF
jgi:hypothetical protein